jgi:hypothetical protein
MPCAAAEGRRGCLELLAKRFVYIAGKLLRHADRPGVNVRAGKNICQKFLTDAVPHIILGLNPIPKK